jgi:hypothetical protein
MKQFDYNNYTKNNPLLKEDIEEAKKSVDKINNIEIRKDKNVLTFIRRDYFNNYPSSEFFVPYQDLPAFINILQKYV